MTKRLIVQGDRTSHGGTVLEGDVTFLIEGKPVALVGHKVSCPKCRGGPFPIVLGAPDAFSMGMALAREGDKTSCGATLISSQALTNWSDETGASATMASAGGAIQSKANQITDNVASTKTDSPYDEQLKILGPDTSAHEGLPYRIETSDGRVFTGTLPASGQLPRIGTDMEDTYHVYWGDEALAKETA